MSAEHSPMPAVAAARAGSAGLAGACCPEAGVEVAAAMRRMSPPVLAMRRPRLAARIGRDMRHLCFGRGVSRVEAAAYFDTDNIWLDVITVNTPFSLSP